MCPFVKSTLGNAGGALKSKRQSGAWGVWVAFASIRWQGRNCSSAADRCSKDVGVCYSTSESSSSVFAYQKQHFWARLHSALGMLQLNDSDQNDWFVKTDTLHEDLSIQRNFFWREMRKLWRIQAILTSSTQNVSTSLFQTKFVSFFVFLQRIELKN